MPRLLNYVLDFFPNEEALSQIYPLLCCYWEIIALVYLDDSIAKRLQAKDRGSSWVSVWEVMILLLLLRQFPHHKETGSAEGGLVGVTEWIRTRSVVWEGFLCLTGAG